VPLVTGPEKLFINLLLVTTGYFIFFTSKDLKNSVLISSADLLVNTTDAVDFKLYRKMQVFQVKIVRYKLLQEQV
jgi:hypothetical protein